MPVRVKKIRGKFRVVEKSGKLARNRAGTPVSKGTKSKKRALGQAFAMNKSMGYIR